MAAEDWSDKMAPDMKVLMKQRCVIEFLHAEKFAPFNIYQHLMNFYGDQMVDVSTKRWWWYVSAVMTVTAVKSTCADFYEHSMRALVDH